jgi:hypothetical protein
LIVCRDAARCAASARARARRAARRPAAARLALRAGGGAPFRARALPLLPLALHLLRLLAIFSIAGRPSFPRSESPTPWRNFSPRACSVMSARWRCFSRGQHGLRETALSFSTRSSLPILVSTRRRSAGVMST